jgi:hypothetical protein
VYSERERLEICAEHWRCLLLNSYNLPISNTVSIILTSQMRQQRIRKITLFPQSPDMIPQKSIKKLWYSTHYPGLHWLSTVLSFCCCVHLILSSSSPRTATHQQAADSAQPTLTPKLPIHSDATNGPLPCSNAFHLAIICPKHTFSISYPHLHLAALSTI